jgi:hypothetical protein
MPALQSKSGNAIFSHGLTINLHRQATCLTMTDCEIVS